MERESWLELERHLHFLLPMDPAERQAYLRQVCGEDSSMRLRVESWLSAENEMGSFLEAKPGVPKLTTPPEPGDDLPQLMEGQRFGAYRVKREIGRGGMSVVALAVHEDLGRHVAIKVIKQSMTSAETLQRFLSERQILANLNHPSIAQFHEGGTSEDGQPYFVMEYIEGEPIDRYCDRLRLSIDERLTLFRRVCRAAHYAHQNLVVHRDIKPSNILVTKKGVPKLLDFGIAKLLDPAPGHHRRLQTT
ncbi:MAG: serine/threonine-protein kinase, partial [Acidobacteriota bacterium]